MSEEIVPRCGYAPGNYHGTCYRCGQSFMGDKHAFVCEPCSYQIEMEYQVLQHAVRLLKEPIQSVEENAGSIWITLTDGSVKSLMIIDCEKEEVPDEQT